MRTSLIPFRALLAVVALGAGVLCAAPAVEPRGPHPRLFYTNERIAELKQRIAAEPAVAAAWKSILATAEAERQKPDAGGRALDALVLAYRMTGDRSYADVVRKYLERELRRPNWGEPDLLRRDPVWQAGLGLARTLRSTAVAFDSIHDVLTPDERRDLAAGIVRLGVRPTLDDWVLGERRIHALDTMGHNWWSACVFTGGLGALAVLDEEPAAGEWLRRISDGSREWFGYAGSLIENKPANFDRNGGFYESVNYAAFAMSEYLAFRLAWTNALATPPADIPLLARAADYFIDVAYPNSGMMVTLNFGDGSLHADGSRPLTLLWANGIHDPNIAWYLNEARATGNREGLDRSSPLGLLYLPPESALAGAPAVPSRPRSAIYPDMGWAMLRTAWSKDATLLGVRAGFTWNHSHADTGSFILHHAGRNLLIDSGNCSYPRPEYDSYYRQSVAHNVVTFNGQAENVEDTYTGSKFPGSLSHLIDTDDLRYLLADATGPTSRWFSRNYRHFVWVGDVILVIDDVESFEPGQFEFLLHADGKVERRGLDLNIAQDEARIMVRPLFPETFPDAGLPTDYPEKIRLIERTGLKDHEPDTKVTYYALAPTELSRRTKFITAITLVTAANKDRLPQLERLPSTDAIGVRIRQGNQVVDLYLNLRADGRIRHRNANNTIAGFETDAYLLAFTSTGEPGGPANSVPTEDRLKRVFVADGSYLRREGRVWLDSLSKVFTTWSWRGSELDVVLQGQPITHLRLGATASPTALSVNGEKRAVRYDAVAKQLLISTEQ